MKNKQMRDMDRTELVDSLSDADLTYVAQSLAPAWSSGTRINGVDVDGFAQSSTKEVNLTQVQKECWAKYTGNPQISSHIIDVQGALTGEGFNIYSDVQKIQEAITEIEDDIRNELKLKYPKYVGRTEIEGELFLTLTVHLDGFIEIDFMDPTALTGGDESSGIYFHPSKKSMPLFYEFQLGDSDSSKVIIPSIYVAHMPILATTIIGKNAKPAGFTDKKLEFSKSTKTKFKSMGGFNKFIISWDRSLFQKRNVSHIQTTIEWINHYENLKKWEIDHKKSSGAYLWVFEMTDAKAFRTWLKMTDTERQECGITAEKNPGGSIILPPGVKLTVQNPKLANISEQDTDIMHMVTSGLNKPEDMVTGQTKGDTFSGVKASRGPQADRTADMICNWERFLRLTFWRSIFLLKHKISTFKLEYKVQQAVAFEKKKAKFKSIMKQAYELIEFEFPVSEVSDISNKAQALLGSKHPNVIEFLGISKAQVAKKLGFSAYRTTRLIHATEEELYPDLPNAAIVEEGAEDAQEISKDKADKKDKEKSEKAEQKAKSALKLKLKK